MARIEYFDYDKDSTVNMLSDFFREQTLVPFIGSGFTNECITSNKKHVPTGDNFRSLMIETLDKHCKLSKEQLEKVKQKNFSEVSDIFFDESFLERHIVEKILEENFTGVNIGENQKKILNTVEWQYIYTLNIDDAIERNSDYNIALPFDSALSEKAKKYKTLFKVHGDIHHELRSSFSRIIFKKSDYYNSLIESKSMLDLIDVDYKNKNIIYIGCSLKNEIDLEFLNNKKNTAPNKTTKRIMFLNERLDIIDEVEYAKLGINCVILFPSGDYGQIYDLICKAYSKSVLKDADLEQFRFRHIDLDKDPDKNKRHIISGVSEISLKREKQLVEIPYYYGERDLENYILKEIYSKNLIVLEGRRVSGKSLLSYSIASKIVDKNVFFIQSTSSLSIPTLKKLLAQENSVIFFDSNTLDNEKLGIIDTSLNRAVDNKSVIVLVANENELYTQSIKSRMDKHGYFKINNKLSLNEISRINEKAKSSKLPTFTSGETLLDKIIKIYLTLGETNIISKVAKDPILFKILYFISAKNKMTGQEIFYSGINEPTAFSAVKTIEPFILLEKLHFGEEVDHSGYKLLSYSTTWTSAILKDYFRTKGVDWCCDRIIELLIPLYKRNKTLAIELRKFDALNFAFSSNNSAAGKLIYKIYDKLEEIEGTEPEFYVQKSKAYFNMYREPDAIEKLKGCIKELVVAETWARTSNSDSTARNILNIRALINLRIFDESKLKDDYIIPTLTSVLNTINDNQNSSYNVVLLKGERYGGKLLKSFMDYLMNYGSTAMLHYKSDIDHINLLMNENNY